MLPSQKDGALLSGTSTSNEVQPQSPVVREEDPVLAPSPSAPSKDPNDKRSTNRVRASDRSSQLHATKQGATNAELDAKAAAFAKKLRASVSFVKAVQIAEDDSGTEDDENVFANAKTRKTLVAGTKRLMSDKKRPAGGRGGARSSSRSSTKPEAGEDDHGHGNKDASSIDENEKLDDPEDEQDDEDPPPVAVRGSRLSEAADIYCGTGFEDEQFHGEVEVMVRKTNIAEEYRKMLERYNYAAPADLPPVVGRKSTTRAEPRASTSSASSSRESRFWKATTVSRSSRPDEQCFGEQENENDDANMRSRMTTAVIAGHEEQLLDVGHAEADLQDVTINVPPPGETDTTTAEAGDREDESEKGKANKTSSPSASSALGVKNSCEQDVDHNSTRKMNGEETATTNTRTQSHGRATQTPSTTTAARKSRPSSTSLREDHGNKDHHNAEQHRQRQMPFLVLLKWKLRFWWHYVILTPARTHGEGHPQMLARGVLAALQGLLSTILFTVRVDRPHFVPKLILQFLNAFSLTYAWRTNDVNQFLFRSVTNFCLAWTNWHAFACGRRWIHAELLSDERHEKKLADMQHAGYPDTLDDSSVICFTPALVTDASQSFLIAFRVLHFLQGFINFCLCINLFLHWRSPAYGARLVTFTTIADPNKGKSDNDADDVANKEGEGVKTAEKVTDDANKIKTPTHHSKEGEHGKQDEEGHDEPDPDEIYRPSEKEASQHDVVEPTPTVVPAKILLVRGTVWLRGRAILTGCAIVIDLLKAIFKNTIIPEGSYFERYAVETVMHFLRGCLLRPLQIASLLTQFYYPR